MSLNLVLFNAACVTILPNDDAYGVFRFDQNSLTTVLQETVGTATTNNGKESTAVLW